jgi:type 1 glutamine amidotransferase
MKRRQMLQTLGSAMLSLPWAARLGSAAENGPRKVLFFSRSVLFEHPVVHREGDRLSLAETTFTQWCQRAGLAVDCSKDGRVFDGDLDQYAAIVSYSCGTGPDMLKTQSKDASPAMSEQGLKRLQDAVVQGKPFVAIHPGFLLLPDVMGTGYIGHGMQQEGKLRVVSPRFPGVQGLGDSLTLTEEWFSLVDFAPDLHVILVQETEGMQTERPVDKKCYNRPPYPATWARQYGKTRAFYTSLGHREDVWANPVFERIAMGGLAWAMGDLQADVTPNIQQVAPRANERTK